MTEEQPLEVCLGPNGSWFWCNDHRCKRFLHLPVLEAAIKSRLDEAPGTLKWVTMGKTSGVALFKDGVSIHLRLFCDDFELTFKDTIVLEISQCTYRFDQGDEKRRQGH